MGKHRTALPSTAPKATEPGARACPGARTWPSVCCSSVGCPTNRTLSIFSSNFWPHISDLVAKIVARMTSENLKI